MKSPLNINSEPNVVHALADDQARVLKEILGLVIFSFISISILVCLILNISGLFYFLILDSLVVIASISLLVYFLNVKNQMAKKLVELDVLMKSFPTLKYNGSQYVSVYTFAGSQLYDEVDFIYRGSDLLKTEQWEVSNLKVKCKTEQANKENKVFRGCFLKYKKSLNLESPIIIKPKIVGRNFSIPKVLNQLVNPYFNPNMERIEIGDQAFDQLFDIYSLDDKETKTFLSEDKTNQILSFYDDLKLIVEKQSSKHKNRIFRPKFDKPLNALELAFHKDGVYLAVREQKLFSLLEKSINTKPQNIIMDLIKYLDNL